MELGKLSMGLIEPDNMVPCTLTPPDGEVEWILYNLFVSAGRLYTDDDDAGGCYSPYSSSVGSTGRMVCQYLGKKLDGVAWEVPEWALSMSRDIREIVRAAESIGREQGYDSGLSAGKRFVMQLAKGEMAPNSYLDADGRDSIRLGRKSW